MKGRGTCKFCTSSVSSLIGRRSTVVVSAVARVTRVGGSEDESFAFARPKEAKNIGGVLLPKSYSSGTMTARKCRTEMAL
jgi:hypothetical protein